MCDINIISRIRAAASRLIHGESDAPSKTVLKMITDTGNGFYAWNGRIYQSDIVRAALRPKAKAIGKLCAKHIRETIMPDGTKDIKVDPEPYIKFLLKEPNPYMTGQMLQEKLANQVMLNGNAFAVVIYDDEGYPKEIYPVPAAIAEAKFDESGRLYIKFTYRNGKSGVFPYSQIIHIRECYADNDIFGESPAAALAPLMEVVNTADQGIVKAIKNSAIVQWLLKYKVSMRKEDLKANAKEFADNYLTLDNDSVGVAAVDAKADIDRIEPKDYVPNAAQTDRVVQRIYSLLGTNSKIVQALYTEDEWNSYYETEIEPYAIQLSEQFSLRLFTRRARAFGNKIYFEAANLACASISTKLNLMQMVDRGALTPNEWRAVFNMAPVEGGDKPIRRLDTRTTEETDGAAADKDSKEG